MLLPTLMLMLLPTLMPLPMLLPTPMPLLTQMLLLLVLRDSSAAFSRWGVHTQVAHESRRQWPSRLLRRWGEGMNTPTRERFYAFNLSLQIIGRLRPLVKLLKQRHPKLADQCERAADSIALNLSEGRRRIGKDRLHLWRIAAGSADEVRACLLVAQAWGHLSLEQIDPALSLLDQELAICWKLTH